MAAATASEHDDRPTATGELRPAGGPVYRLCKRVTDRCLAAIALLLAGLPLVLIAWWVRRDSPGPALFRQTRVGRFGRPFQMLKFRTMRTDVDPFGDSPQDGSDPRITRFGRFLRETSLDELPQLLNVLRGDMSLVGPRPLYLQQMAEWDGRQRQRLRTWPGLTGLAQVSGRGSLTIEEKLELDVQYVERASGAMDLWIIWQTLVGVVRRQDIYEKRYSAKRARRSE